MKNRFWLYRRKKGGTFYAHDSEIGKQESLGTKDRAEATTLLNARNESFRQPQLNGSDTRRLKLGSVSSPGVWIWREDGLRQNDLDEFQET